MPRIDARAGRDRRVGAATTAARVVQPGDLGLGAVSQELDRRRQQAEEKQQILNERQDRNEVASSIADARRDMALMVDKASNDYDGAKPGFAAAMREQLEIDMERRIATAGPRVADELSQRYRGVIDQLEMSSLDIETQRREGHILRGVRGTIDSTTNAIAADPALYFSANEDLDDVLAGTPPALRDAVRQEAEEAFFASYAAGRIENDPGGFLEELDAGSLDDAADPVAMSRARASAQREIEQQAREAERQADRQRLFALVTMAPLAEDHIASLAATGEGVEGFDEDRYLDVLGQGSPGQAVAFRREAAQARAVFDAIGDVRDLTQADMAARLEEARPVAGRAGFADAQDRFTIMQRTFSDHIEARQNDPAGYALASPIVAQAASDFASAQAGGNAEQLAAASQIYAEAQISEQERLGIPARDQRILRPGDVQARLQTLAAAGPDERASATRDLVAGLDVWGEYRGQVMAELRAGGLDPMTQVIATLPGAADQTRLARASANLSTLQDMVPESQRTDLREEVDERMADFTASLGHTASGHQSAAQAREAAYLLALEARATGVSEGRAAREGVRAITGHYDLSNGYRIPVRIADARQSITITLEAGPGQAASASQAQRMVSGERLIAHGTEAVMDALVSDHGARLTSTEGDTRLGPRERGEAMADAVRQSGRWITMADESGLMLVAAPDGIATPVRDARGAPVMMGWDDIQALGRTALERGDTVSQLDDVLARDDAPVPDGTPRARPRRRTMRERGRNLPVIGEMLQNADANARARASNTLNGGE